MMKQEKEFKVSLPEESVFILSPSFRLEMARVMTVLLSNNPSYLKDLSERLYSEKKSLNDKTDGWVCLVDGIAYNGEITSLEECKDGIGQMIDIWGNYIFGLFRDDFFTRGIVVHKSGKLYEITENNKNYLEGNTEFCIFSNGDKYTGSIKNGVPHGQGSLILDTKLYLGNTKFKYSKIIGGFQNGVPVGLCTIWIDFERVDKVLTCKVIFSIAGEISTVLAGETPEIVYYHNCPIEEIDRHTGFSFAKSDGALLYHGMSSFLEQNGLGYNLNLEFKSKVNISARRRQHSGLAYHRYCSSGTFIENDWRHDEQVAIGRQYLRLSGVIVEGEWGSHDGHNRILEIRRVITSSGGIYTREGAESEDYVFMKIKEKVVEKVADQGFYEGKHRQYFITINSSFNASVFSQIQICSGSSLETIDKMISYTLSGTSEGSARLDTEYCTGEFEGLGEKKQYLINYSFKGQFKSDEPSNGIYNSPYLQFEGTMDNYVLENGTLSMEFCQGYIFKGSVTVGEIIGHCSLTLPSGETISGPWKQGVFLNDPRYVIAHGDEKRRLHRVCLLVKRQGHFSIDSGSQIQQDVDVLTSRVYNKKFESKEISINVVENKNPSIQRITGKLEIYSLTSMAFRELDKISNPKINGEKSLSKISYFLDNREWSIQGEFSSKRHYVERVEIRQGWETKFALSRLTNTNIACPVFSLEDWNMPKKEELDILTFLEADKFSDLEFRYSVFDELDERVIISKLTENQCPTGVFSGRAVIYHLDGAISFGQVTHNFLHGRGERRNIAESKISKVSAIWEADQPVHDVEVRYSFGAIYRGSYILGERHGRGKMNWDNGEQYEGDWFAGLKHGIGRYVWSTGEIYDGEYKLNMMWGDGKLSFQNGDCFEGKFWRNELKEGKRFKESGAEIND